MTALAATYSQVADATQNIMIGGCGWTSLPIFTPSRAWWQRVMGWASV
jgi:hypothetical protein